MPSSVAFGCGTKKMRSRTELSLEPPHLNDHRKVPQMAARPEKSPTHSASKDEAWRALEQHYAKMRSRHLRDLFAEDPTRGERLTAEAAGMFLDYSKNRVDDETLRLLLQLAEQSGLRGR